MVIRKRQTNGSGLRIAALVLFITITSMAFAGLVAAREIKDIDITLAIERQLQKDEGVPAHLIDVRTKDGIVTLSGPVENLLARERAPEIAATIKGVRSVINFIDVLSIIRSDAQIRSLHYTHRRLRLGRTGRHP